MKALRVILYEGAPCTMFLNGRYRIVSMFFVSSPVSSCPNRGKKDLDCRRVRVHHKPVWKTDPSKDCCWVKVQSGLFPCLLSQKKHVLPPFVLKSSGEIQVS